jgi:ankyrin repeat protein
LKSLKPNGYYFLANAGLSHIIIGKWNSLTSSKKVVLGSASQKKEDLLYLKELLEAGADPNAQDEYGKTSLMRTSECYVTTVIS